MLAIQNNIIAIQDLISQGKISSITFTISEPSREDNNMPVVDYLVEGENGNPLVGDLEFETLEDAISDLVKSIKQVLK